jgi:hypothetical protein
MTVVSIIKKPWLYKVFLLLYSLHVTEGEEICTQKITIKEVFHLETLY